MGRDRHGRYELAVLLPHGLVDGADFLRRHVLSNGRQTSHHFSRITGFPLNLVGRDSGPSTGFTPKTRCRDCSRPQVCRTRGRSWPVGSPSRRANGRPVPDRLTLCVAAAGPDAKMVPARVLATLAATSARPLAYPLPELSPATFAELLADEAAVHENLEHRQVLFERHHHAVLPLLHLDSLEPGTGERLGNVRGVRQPHLPWHDPSCRLT